MAMTKLTKAKISKAIEGSGGIMSTIAKRLGCDWKTAKKYVDKFGLAEDVELQKETLIDLAEGKLFENIRNNDTTAIIFCLKTLGKNRGYAENQQQHINNNGLSGFIKNLIDKSDATTT